MAVTDEFKQDVLEVLNEYTAALENQTGPNAAPFMAEDELDETVTMPALKYTENPLTSSRAQPDSYRQVPMVTFFNRIDKLAQHVDDAATRAAADHTRAEQDHTRAEQDHTDALEATAGAQKVNATLVGMTVTVTDRNGQSRSQNIGFEITEDHVYPSVAAMQADAANVLPGKFCMVATTDKTSEENARLYTKNSAGGFTFLSDLDQAATHAFADWMENYKPVIEADHSRAESDHSTAVSDTGRAATDHQTATRDHENYTADRQTFADNEAARQQTFETNEAQRQEDFENAEADRMATMTVTRPYVDTDSMCLMFIQPKSDSTEYKVVNGCLNIITHYAV